MIRIAALAAVLAVAGATVVVAQNDPIAARKAAMKQKGAATAEAAKMARGDAPFNLDAAKKTFQVYLDVAKVAPGLFPASSKTGGDTTASPKIWEDEAGFKAAFAKMEKDATDALASVKDLDTFKVAFGNATKNCAGCHQLYRITK